MTNYDDNNKPSYFSILTADVRYDVDLSASEKIFYSEITCLCQKDGYCYANNSYFANLYNCGTRTISSWISKLVNKKYINVIYEKTTNTRKIFIVVKYKIDEVNKEKLTAREEKQREILKAFWDKI